MDVAALGTWMLAVLAGFYLLDTWLPEAGPEAGAGQRRGGASDRPANARVDNLLAGSHILCAVSGWMVWMFFVLNRNLTVGRIALVFVVLAAGFGLSMVSRWLPSRVRAGRLSRAASRSGGMQGDPPELQRIPIKPMLGHGLFAVATLVLVVVTVL